VKTTERARSGAGSAPFPAPRTSLGPWALALLLFLGISFLTTPSALAARQGVTTVEALILSPDPGERVEEGSYLVALSFIDPGGRLDPTSIRLVVGGQDVTAQANISGEVVTWRPIQPLPRGTQRAVVTARDRNGVSLPPTSWSFTIDPPRSGRPTQAVAPAAGTSGGLPAWARMQGSVISEVSTASVSGPGAATRRGEDFLPLLWLNAGGIISGSWRYSARIHLSGYESSTSQPVNRYQVTLRSERTSLSFGDVNPQIQELILVGRRVRGIQGEGRAGLVGLSVVAGETRRAIEPLLDGANPTFVARSGSFAQDLVAIRPTIGSPRSVQGGLTLLRVRDDVNSISELRTAPSSSDGSTRSANPLPKDNIVLGTDLTARLLGGRVVVQYENAFSLLANDISGGPLSQHRLDSIAEAQGYAPPGIDPERWERYFIMNASMIPLDPTALTSLAQQLRSTFQIGGHYLSAEWRSIGGSYTSLGNPSLERDRTGFRIRDSFAALDRTVAATFGFEWDEDNLNGVKGTTTSSTGFSADLSWQTTPERPALSASLRLGARSNPLAADEVGAVDETSRTLAFGVSYPVALLDGWRHRLNANVSLLTREDTSNPFVGSRNVYYLVGTQGETLDRASRFSLLYGLNRSELTNFEDAATDFHRVALAARQRVAPRWAAIAEGVLTRARTSDAGLDFGLRYDREEFLVGGEFEWTGSAFVTFEAGVVSYRDERFADLDTREILTRVRVSRAF